MALRGNSATKTSLGNFECGQLGFQARQQCASIQLGTRFGNDNRHAHFAKISIRDPHHGTFGHTRQRVDHALRLSAGYTL